jgi:hypothetical protein
MEMFALVHQENILTNFIKIIFFCQKLFPNFSSKFNK